METRVAVMGIIVENWDSVDELNALLHNYGEYIIGRMGIPYREKNINVISIAIDAPHPAPADTPRISGEAMRLLNNSWYTQPADDKAAPTSKEAINRGNLLCVIIRYTIRFSFG